jgi:YidC/Oxa1 family membrane protein insertase
MPDNEEQFVQRRLLVASLLSAVAMMGYFYFYQPEGSPLVQPAEQAVEAPAEPAAPAQIAPATEAPATEATAAEGEQAPLPVQAEAEREIVVETEKFEVTFSNRGAVVRRWVLKDYKDVRGEPLNLVHQPGAEAHGYPFRLQLSGGEAVPGLDDALFQVNEGPDRRTGDAVVEFQYADGAREVRKTFRFRGDGYELGVETQLTENGAPRMHLIAWPGGFGDTSHLGDHTYSSVFYWDAAEGLERNAAADAEDGRITNQGEYSFAGIDDLFFAAAFRARESQPVQVETAAIEIDPLIPDREGSEIFASTAIGSSTGNQFELYVGPKSLNDLRALDPRMGDIVDFGWFSFVAEPLFLMLRWTHANIVANWGWSIVLVTIVINIALFPLKWKGNKSTKRMQQLQPLIKQINEKYKGLKMSDPKKQQQQEETMELYKKYNVNPIGGCFPMLLQLPFFIGFYNVLTHAIEMRGAEWLFVNDLSQPENWLIIGGTSIHILPLAMMGAQFWMQVLTPMPSVDPAQARMMKFMPLMMGVIFWGFQSGLVIYWLTMNLVGVGQQMILNKMPGDDLEIEIPGRKPIRKKK